MSDTLLQRATFLKSAAKPTQLPADVGAEVAFAGRSNAGKSSALNALTAQRSLARISKTPGRTQLINFFPVSDDQRLVDLPGYGFAKVPNAIRAEWGKLMDHYFTHRMCLRGLILVMDIRHPLTEFDQHMLAWARDAGLPCHCLLTKADKLSRGAASNQRLKVSQQLREYGSSVQIFSAKTRDGVATAREQIITWLNSSAELRA